MSQKKKVNSMSSAVEEDFNLKDNSRCVCCGLDLYSIVAAELGYCLRSKRPVRLEVLIYD